MAVIANGVNEKDINHALMEHFSPGQPFVLELELDRSLTYEQVKQVGDELVEKGMDIQSISMDGTTLHIVSNRPHIADMSSNEYGIVWWVPVAAIGGVVFLTGAGIISWRLLDAITENFTQFLVVSSIAVIAGIVVFRKYK